MGWPTPSLDDVILSNDTGGKRWLHALCLALNERQGCLGFTKTQFVFGDGSEAADPAIDDFTDVWIGGERDGAITNLNRCMAGLKAMLTHEPTWGTFYTFKTTSGSSGGDWTLAALQTDIGLGSFGTAADGWTDLTFWKQMKEAFDRLIYVQRIFPKSSLSGTSLQENVWPPTTPGGSFPSVSVPSFQGDITWYQLYTGTTPPPFPTYSFLGTTRTDATASFNLTALSGSLTESYYRLVRHLSGTWPANESFTVDDVSFGTSDGTGDYATAGLSLGGNNVIGFDFDDSTPDTPSALSGSYPSLFAWQGLSIYYAKLYYDIASELTDQT